MKSKWEEEHQKLRILQKVIGKTLRNYLGEVVDTILALIKGTQNFPNNDFCNSENIQYCILAIYFLWYTKGLRIWGNEDNNFSYILWRKLMHYQWRKATGHTVAAIILIKSILEKKDLDIYQERLKGNPDGIKRMTLLLRIMMNISRSMGACKWGFSCMNLQKHTFVWTCRKNKQYYAFIS